MTRDLENTIRSLLALDRTVDPARVDRAMRILRGNPHDITDVDTVVANREAMRMLNVSRYTLHRYISRGFLKPVLGTGRKAIGVTLSSFNHFIRARTPSAVAGP